MKHDFRLQTSDFRLVAVVLYGCLVALAAAAVAANPYEAIVGRNVFGLKPPTINTAPPPPVAAAATTIKLQGISTILDRRQVMLKVNTAARPPEPAKEQSYLMIEGQREGEIEVLEIDATTGTVKIKNSDTPLSLNMKDDAVKPAVGAALPGPVVPPPLSAQLPGLPAPANPGLPVPGGAASVTTIGGGARTLPTRTLRSGAGGDSSGFNGRGAPSSGAGTTTTIATPQNNLSPEAQAILIEAQRAQISGSGYDPLPKTGITPR